MPPAKLERTLLLLAALAMLAGCGPGERREAELAAAPVRQVLDNLASHPKWQAGRCLCVGLFRGEEVEDFPAGLLDEEYAKHRWVRRWSSCAPLYGMAKGLPGCAGGMTDYICGIAEASDPFGGKSRVKCHVNGKNELLTDEYDVTETDGRLAAARVVSTAFNRLNER
jgi:hypothetical protein